jgi:hypothetical protein
MLAHAAIRQGSFAVETLEPSLHPITRVSSEGS